MLTHTDFIGAMSKNPWKSGRGGGEGNLYTNSATAQLDLHCDCPAKRHITLPLDYPVLPYYATAQPDLHCDCPAKRHITLPLDYPSPVLRLSPLRLSCHWTHHPSLRLS